MTTAKSLQVCASPAHLPIITLPIPEVVLLPAQVPIKILSVPPDILHPEQDPSET